MNAGGPSAEVVRQGSLLWQPSEDFAKHSNLHQFMQWLAEQRGLEFADYDELWQWSTDNIDDFWAALWDYFAIRTSSPYHQVRNAASFGPGVEWFSGSAVNFAEHVLAPARQGTAIWALSEQRPLYNISWSSLRQQVRILAEQLRALDIRPGDGVVSLLPNCPEAVIAMLATVSVGGIWSNAAPEFGLRTVHDRFAQMHPKLLFTVDGYHYQGKPQDKGGLNCAVIEALPSLKTVVFLPYLDAQASLPTWHRHMLSWPDLLNGHDPGAAHFSYYRATNQHPLWVVFSSGTTGLPKAIVHNHVGVLLEMLKFMTFHLNLKPTDVAFFYTTTGWVMFNLVVGMLLTGAAIVLYDGAPAYPQADVLWEMAAQTGTTLFGASPGYVQLMQRQHIVPKQQFDLSALNSILVGGSPASAETFAWFYENVNNDLWVTSQSGGTEIASGFVGGVPTLPVYAGEIQARALGMAVDCWDESGNSLVDTVGELVCTKPFPSMPICFLNDANAERYHHAYFAEYPHVWRHGDFLLINQRGGCYILGRSDSTLNRHGVRIGTAEVYAVVEATAQVDDSLVLCWQQANGEFVMPLFVQLNKQHSLTSGLINSINQTLRQQCSPRHVPDYIIAVTEIPYTLTGKKLEVPTRRVLAGEPLEAVISRDAMRNPDAINFFVDLAQQIAVQADANKVFANLAQQHRKT